MLALYEQAAQEGSPEPWHTLGTQGALYRFLSTLPFESFKLSRTRFAPAGQAVCSGEGSAALTRYPSFADRLLPWHLLRWVRQVTGASAPGGTQTLSYVRLWPLQQVWLTRALQLCKEVHYFPTQHLLKQLAFLCLFPVCSLFPFPPSEILFSFLQPFSYSQ